MKKLLVILTLFLLANIVFAEEVKDELYYKRQIQNQRYLYSNNGMLQALQQKNDYALECFIKAGFSPDTAIMGVPLSFFAVKYKNINALDILLKNGADPNSTTIDTNLLIWSIHYKNSDAVSVLTKYNVDVNRKFKSTLPLNKAISLKQVKIVETLLKNGAKPDNKTMKLINKSKDDYLKDLFAEE